MVLHRRASKKKKKKEDEDEEEEEAQVEEEEEKKEEELFLRPVNQEKEDTTLFYNLFISATQVHSPYVTIIIMFMSLSWVFRGNEFSVGCMAV